MGKQLRLWYREPAEEWTDSLPLGNGRIGAMVFGGIHMERIGLNEDTLWSGYPCDKNNQNAAQYLQQARQLCRENCTDDDYEDYRRPGTSRFGHRELEQPAEAQSDYGCGQNDRGRRFR